MTLVCAPYVCCEWPTMASNSEVKKESKCFNIYLCMSVYWYISETNERRPIETREKKINLENWKCEEKVSSKYLSKWNYIIVLVAILSRLKEAIAIHLCPEQSKYIYRNQNINKNNSSISFFLSLSLRLALFPSFLLSYFIPHPSHRALASKEIGKWFKIQQHLGRSKTLREQRRPAKIEDIFFHREKKIDSKQPLCAIGPNKSNYEIVYTPKACI